MYLPLLGSVVDAVFGHCNETGVSLGKLRLVSANPELVSTRTATRAQIENLSGLKDLLERGGWFHGILEG